MLDNEMQEHQRLKHVLPCCRRPNTERAPPVHSPGMVKDASPCLPLPLKQRPSQSASCCPPPKEHGNWSQREMHGNAYKQKDTMRYAIPTGHRMPKRDLREQEPVNLSISR